jgi:hypothetical protein
LIVDRSELLFIVQQNCLFFGNFLSEKHFYKTTISQSPHRNRHYRFDVAFGKLEFEDIHSPWTKHGRA